jgi:hypothetical protein
MKKILMLLCLFLSTFTIKAQLNKLIVETYYISDNNDSTDEIGGKLLSGSKTYRVFAELEPGSKLTKIYGDENHLLRISSDAHFFNNLDRGKTFGKDHAKNTLNENTVALDSWLTIGMVSKTHAGILKINDKDGSFLGGKNNDGGSASIAGGMLKNQDAQAGIPITVADGQYLAATAPVNWADYGITDALSGRDSSIFGSLIAAKEFKSNNAGLQNSGVLADSSNNNHILIAQLTTKGNLSFELNLEVINADGSISKYVADDKLLMPGEIFSRHLKYPFDIICGCPDKEYIEFKKDRDCDSQDSCKNLYVLGCMDTLACNYDPKATFNVRGMCCYPGYCNDRDLAIVCPDLGIKVKAPLRVSLYPNPTQDKISLEIIEPSNMNVTYSIYDSYGNLLSTFKNVNFLDNQIQELNLSKLNNGLYILKLNRAEEVVTKMFMKN